MTTNGHLAFEERCKANAHGFLGYHTWNGGVGSRMPGGGEPVLIPGCALVRVRVQMTARHFDILDPFGASFEVHPYPGRILSMILLDDAGVLMVWFDIPEVFPGMTYWLHPQ